MSEEGHQANLLAEHAKRLDRALRDFAAHSLEAHRLAIQMALGLEERFGNLATELLVIEVISPPAPPAGGKSG